MVPTLTPEAGLRPAISFKASNEAIGFLFTSIRMQYFKCERTTTSFLWKMAYTETSEYLRSLYG